MTLRALIYDMTFICHRLHSLFSIASICKHPESAFKRAGYDVGFKPWRTKPARKCHDAMRTSLSALNRAPNPLDLSGGHYQ